MFGIYSTIGLFLCGGLLFSEGVGGEQALYRKQPWPTYSLQNMPQTQFTCHDKILGGYYADSETQCQMFHVCVKVAGVGVQDFRFLCPNATAFDQEAQICADWGDVDCDQSVLYYGSDNFDLYRIGSGFESKRAPAAEEEESTFHLQRAESADIRRSKETRIDQKSRPDQPPNYTKRYEAAARNSFHNYANQNQQQQVKPDAAKRPIVNYYQTTTTTTTPTRPSTTTKRPTAPTTTTTTTDRYANDESKQDFDEIFKGSHSSNFFANRHGGREDDFNEHGKSLPNALSVTSKKSEFSTSTTTGKARAQPTRPKRIQTSSATTTTAATSSAPLSAVSKFSKKLSLQTSFKTDSYDHTPQYYKSSSAAATSSAPSPTTPRPSHSNAQRFSFSPQEYAQTQERIQPTTYNPGSGAYRVKATTPRYSDESTRSVAKGRTDSPKQAPKKSPKLGPQNSTFVNRNEFAEFAKVKSPAQTQSQQQLLPQPFQVARKASGPKVAETPQPIEPQFFRSRTSPAKQSRAGNQDPAPFSAAPQKQRGGSAAEKPSKFPATAIAAELKPRGFASRGSINYKATTQRSGELSTPSTQSGAKKFSTLVPKEQYTPTTFRPTTYKKPYDQSYYQVQQQQTQRPARPTPAASSSTALSPALPTTANPYYDPDEDDGQYHPELYEVDFPRNRLHLQRASSGQATSSTTVRANVHNAQSHLKTQQQTSLQKQQQQQQHRQRQPAPAAEPEGGDLSDEEELFKTAHSLNFGAASINKLRADIYKAEKTSQQYNSQYSPRLPEAPSAAAQSTTQAAASPTYAPLSTSSRHYTSSATASATFTTPSTTTLASTTRRPITSTTSTPITTAKSSTLIYSVTKSGKSSKGGKGGKKVKPASGASKRPPHADEDTSYDYAYYDTDMLSESPQDYPEYAIAEFARTRKN